MLFADANDPLQLGSILMAVFGGLALFLFGLEQMADALKLIAGDSLKQTIASLTTNRFRGLVAGTFVTAIIQSSSVTSVLVIGFISAGLLNLPQAMGIILGADIGTTITAQIVAFRVTRYALILVALGVALLLCFRNETVKHYGHVVMGLGLIFFGMQLMNDGTLPLRDYPPFLNAMQQMNNPLLAILLGALFTGVIQSSSATMGVVIVLASQGLVSLGTGIALCFGANIGTCNTALLASIGKPREAVRAAVAHILFKLGGVLIWLAFINQLGELASWISPTYPQLAGSARMAAETPRQIANAHTVFNVGNALLFIWFINPFARLLEQLLPDREEVVSEVAAPRFLDPILLETPALALDVVRRELGRLGDAALRMVCIGLATALHGTRAELDALERLDDDVDSLHGAIVTYLGRLSQENLSGRQSKQLRDCLSAANYIESIGDMIETNLVEAGRQRLAHGVLISPKTEQILDAFHRKVCWAVERSVAALDSGDVQIAREVIAAKDEINRLSNAAEVHLSRRLTADEPQRLATFRLESEMIEYLKRMYYFAKRIAKIVDEPDSDLTEAETDDESDAAETAAT